MRNLNTEKCNAVYELMRIMSGTKKTLGRLKNKNKKFMEMSSKIQIRNVRNLQRKKT